MCTVTIIPTSNSNFVLTSNRDEAPNRTSLAPEFYNVEGVKTLFPKDEQSGGTWVGVSQKHRVVCVLNGAFKPHLRKPKYRKSRGLVAKDLMIADDIESTIESYDFTDIEPFTIVIADWNTDLVFFELIWDGNQKHFTNLPLAPKIWSSSTLYNDVMKAERHMWFDNFIKTHALTADNLLEFHNEAGKNKPNYGVVMDRGFVKTTSITQIEKQGTTLHMAYENIHDKTVANQIFNLSQTINE